MAHLHHYGYTASRPPCQYSTEFTLGFGYTHRRRGSLLRLQDCLIVAQERKDIVRFLSHNIHTPASLRCSDDAADFPTKYDPSINLVVFVPILAIFRPDRCFLMPSILLPIRLIRDISLRIIDLI